MNKLFKWIILLGIWNSILFYGKNLGISVVLFVLPLIIFLYYVLKTNKKINNKKGLLLIIPIVLLTISYFIFDSTFFNILNALIIPILIILMFIITIKPTNEINIIIKNFLEIIVKPFSHISRIMNIIMESLSNKIKISYTTKKLFKSILIVLPLLLIVLVLLSSADIIFGNIMSKIFNVEYLKELFRFQTIKNLLYRIMIIVIFFIYIAATINYLLFTYSKEKEVVEKTLTKKDNFTIKVLLSTLNIVYLVFDCIQIKSLLLHSVSSNINYAEYARQGFFQLLFISLINIVILLISKRFEDKKDKSKNRYVQVMSLIMVILTLVIIVSSFLRMNLYENEYGYTFLRLLVYITLITEVILLIPTIIYIFKPNFKVSKYYFIMIITIYTLINFINVDGIIATRNISRYYEKNDIDIEYLENDNTNNIPMLIDFYNKVENKEIKKELKKYFKSLDIEMNGFQEFNLSKYYAQQKLKRK